MSDTTLLQGELRLEGRMDARFFSLLPAVASTGSINRAARTAGYSYKGAPGWRSKPTATWPTRRCSAPRRKARS